MAHASMHKALGSIHSIPTQAKQDTPVTSASGMLR